MTNHEKKWWKEGVVYQIYPASFKDSNGDGLGDVPGIISKVDYLKDLGVDIVWISPMYESPQVDMGYDISNYENVYPPYGTVQDMETLIKACHDRGMRLILDLVVNHTSDQHAWFKESRSSKDNPKRDWYIWKPAKFSADGTRLPPNNWRSYFGGSVWQWDDNTQEYYLHLFAKEQPDLNWENPDTREAIYNSAMRFWLDKGVDGFRVDTVNMYSKGVELQDAPIVDKDSFIQPAWDIYANGPRIHEFLREMNEKVLDKYDSMTVGELPHTPDPKRVLQYVGAADKQLSMVFQFDIVDLGQGAAYKYEYRQWKLSQLKKIVEKWQRFIEGTDAWTTAFCENHDQGRSVSRYGSDSPEYRALSAKMLSLMLASKTGTLFVYQGQEIGMINVPEDWPIDEYKDIESTNYYKELLDAGKDKSVLEYARKSLRILARDNARIPMQWDSSPHAGFTTKKEGGWMRTHDLFPEINVAKQQAESDSVLAFWKSAIMLRKKYKDLFVYGSFEVLEAENEQTFVFVKQSGDEKALVTLNFTSEDQKVGLGFQSNDLELLIGNYDDAAEKDAGSLRPWEGRVYLVR